MRLEARLAWRNVWRNARRTALCVAATVFAVLLVVVFVAMAAGIHEKMIEDAVRMQSGHVTLSAEGYREDQTLEHYIAESDALTAAIEEAPGVVGWAPRVTSFALLSQDSASHGVVVMGVDPAREAAVTTLPERVVRGRFLEARGESERPQIVLGRRLAESLKAEVGDELLVYSVAYSLETAYALFEVVGVIRLPSPEMERGLALVDLADAQTFYVFEDKWTEIAILARDADAAAELASHLEGLLASGGFGGLELRTWDQLMPELVQFILLDDAGMYVLLIILVVVVGFGILNTILMSVLERTRELGVVMALGLRPLAMFRVVYLESMFLAGLGLVIGFLISIPIVLVMQAHPIPLTGSLERVSELVGFEPVIVFKLKPLNPIGSTLTIFGVAALASFYPAVKASRSRPVDSLRSV